MERDLEEDASGPGHVAVGRGTRRLLYVWASISAVLSYYEYRAKYPAVALQTMLSFLPSLLLSELAPQALLLHIIVLYWIMQKRGIQPTVSALASMATSLNFRVPRPHELALLVGLFSNVLSIHCLSLMTISQFFNSRKHFRKALDSAGVAAHKTRGSGWSMVRIAALLVPLPFVLSSGIRSVRSVVYGAEERKKRSRSSRVADTPGGIESRSVELKELKMDIYWDQHKKMENAPVFMYIHGGGWVTGHRSYHSLPLLYAVANSGWVVCSINYRLASQSGVRVVPEMITDCKRALAWIRERIHEYGGDGQFVVCGGESAGGHLSSLLTLTPNDPRFQEGFEHVDTSVKACVDLYGAVDLTNSGNWYNAAVDPKGNRKRFLQFAMRRSLNKHRDKFEAASPLLIVRKKAAARRQDRGSAIPPIMIVHGNIDTLVAPGESVEFYRALQEYRAAEGGNERDVLVMLPEAHHAFNFAVSYRSNCLSDAVVDFLRSVLARSHRSSL